MHKFWWVCQCVFCAWVLILLAEIFSHQISNPFSRVHKFSIKLPPSLPPQQHWDCITSKRTEKTLKTWVISQVTEHFSGCVLGHEKQKLLTGILSEKGQTDRNSRCGGGISLQFMMLSVDIFTAFRAKTNFTFISSECLYCEKNSLLQLLVNVFLVVGLRFFQIDNFMMVYVITGLWMSSRIMFML